MSTQSNPGSPEQKVEKKKKIIKSQFRSLLLLAAIYSLIIHHVQKNEQSFPPVTIRAGVSTQGVESSVNKNEGTSNIRNWDFRNASYVAPREFDNSDKKEDYGN